MCINFGHDTQMIKSLIPNIYLTEIFFVCITILVKGLH